MIWIYLLGIFTITALILFLYFINLEKYSEELKKIEILEQKMKKKNDDLEII